MGDTVGSVMSIQKCDERTARRILNKAGQFPKLDEEKSDPSEPVGNFALVRMVFFAIGLKIGRLVFPPYLGIKQRIICFFRGEK